VALTAIMKTVTTTIFCGLNRFPWNVIFPTLSKIYCLNCLKVGSLFYHFAWIHLLTCKILHNLVKINLHIFTVWTKDYAIRSHHSDMEASILNNQNMSTNNQRLFSSYVVQNSIWSTEVKQNCSKLRVWLQALKCQTVFSLWIEIRLDTELKHTHTNTCTVIHNHTFRCFNSSAMKLETYTMMHMSSAKQWLGNTYLKLCSQQ
jgi:hypothetical protein